MFSFFLEPFKFTRLAVRDQCMYFGFLYMDFVDELVEHWASAQKFPGSNPDEVSTCLNFGEFFKNCCYLTGPNHVVFEFPKSRAFRIYSFCLWTIDFRKFRTQGPVRT